ncbi:putative alpha-1,2-mannosidase [Catalinimonas alkaloidigena]|uniref:GH92 family glycosyl hydrolase n=1 Tax=Catalinimonas alkaloidigena TaxID=1075417 RepID=UPI0024055DB7|nr:GH92 family glycosyl hydrolase [Catalinimonas alkaloidigena]MDF9796612.1 putative alpha-1,2-mannosidase [Catalinimonas alkaloidigena]
MKYILNFTKFALLLLLMLWQVNVAVAQQKKQPLDYVNTLMGTDSEFTLSNGNTYPAVALPWGMNFWTPQTSDMGDGWGYKYDDYKIRGIKQTHQPSPWINDYAAFALMAMTGQPVFDEEERGSWFSHKAEIAKPHYYKVYLADYDVMVEVTPTERAAVFRFTFPESDSSYILLDAFNKGSKVSIDKAGRKIVGYCRNNSGGVPDNFHNYFVAEFSKDFTLTHTWEDSVMQENSTAAEGNHSGGFVGFPTTKGEVVTVKVASSFISPEQAALNLKREVGGADFDTILSRAEESWNKELSRIEVEGGTTEQKATFYSCLYRILLFPRKFYEFNAQDEMVHYSPYNGEVLPGYMFTDNGFWDTFRAVFPFFTLMYPEFNSNVMQGLVNTYKESGWLPEWASPGHRGSMIGSNSAVNIADSYLKGIRGYDIETLYEAMIKNTKSVGPIHSVGRYGADYYNELGYVPYDVGINENAARSLEYAFADFNIAELAKALGKPQKEVALYEKRAQNYHKLFDEETGLMRGKNEDGTFQQPFNPFKWGDAFTEGNSWHYSWSVFQDIEGLSQLMGGHDAFVNKLDSVFTLPPIFDDSYYGFPIHEIREMQIVNMGQYAHGNQPIQHMVYLYNYAGQPWKTQYHVRNVMNKLYTPYPDGYCGDEDNGQTSAWYVFSAMGFYPVTPGTQQYVLGSPVFERVTLHLPNGETFIIDAEGNDKETPYIEEASLNGQTYTRNYLEHDKILEGVTLKLEMSTQPAEGRGTEPDDFPFSMTKP